MCDPSDLPPHEGRGRLLRGWGPLFDLPALQARLRSGELDLSDDQQCWVATNACWDELAKLNWTTGRQPRDLLLALRPGTVSQGGDFVNAQWCADSEGALWPCDAYKVRVDEHKNFRCTSQGLEFYVKFSVNEAGEFSLVLIQCHLGRFRLRS